MSRPSTANRNRAAQLFVDCYRLDTAGRAALLDEACNGDVELRAAVESLLDNHDRASPDAFNALESGTAAPRVSVPETIGPYTILDVLGRGGMGIVYRAEQQRPRRIVALKVLQPGLVRDDMLKRFEQEAEVLGLLQHPGIAAIHDAGTCDFGYGEMPYFAMELVRGRPLTEFAAELALDARARCALIAKTCDAVQHAHERGVIHRDLKPGNVLVTEPETGSGEAQPKILDFGIARTAETDLQLSTMQTSTGQLLGTLPYMSPEQVSGGLAGIDARSDVYSLGVMLYELLAGRLPLDFEGRPLTEVGHIVTDEDPALLGRVDRAYRGDVETICDKALAKEKEQRYGSAQELADDLRRYLRNEPITARPQTTWYQLKKFARRNKTLVGGVAATFAVLVAGIIVAILLFLRAQRGEDRAERKSYAAQIASANAIIATDPLAARDTLLDTPEELRGWEWHWLHAQLDPAELAFDVPGQYMSNVAFSADGKPLAATKADRTASLYDVTSGELLAEFVTRGTARDTFLAPGGRRLAATSVPEDAKEPAHLQIWDTSTKRVLYETEIHNYHLTTGRGAFSPDGRYFVTMSSKAVRVHDLDAGTEVRGPPEGHSYWGPKFTADGARFWLAGRELETATAKILSDRRPHNVRGTLPSPDGKLLLNALLGNRYLTLEDAASRRVLRRLSGHTRDFVYQACFTPDSRFAITSNGYDVTTRIWDVATGTSLRVLAGGGGRVVCAPDGSALLQAGWIEQQTWVRLISLAGHDAAARVLEQPTYVYAVAANAKHGLVASGCFNGDVQLLDAWSGKRLARFRMPAQVSGLAFSADGRRLRIAGRDSIDLATLDRSPWCWREAHGLRSGNECASPDGRLRAGISGTKVTVVDQDGRSADVVLELGRVDVSELARHRRPQRTGFQAVAISSDNRRLAVSRPDGHIELWDLRTRSLLGRLRGHAGTVYSVAFWPDGTRLLSGGNDGSIRVWRTDSFDEVAHLRGHENYVHGVAVSNDGTLVASGSGDRTARVWDSVKRAERRHQALLVEAMRPAVSAWLREVGDPGAVFDRIAADRALDDARRNAAQRALFETAFQKAR